MQILKYRNKRKYDTMMLVSFEFPLQNKKIQRRKNKNKNLTNPLPNEPQIHSQPSNFITMSSNKQNLDFYLPSLINNHKFQQIFFHHNKLIVYDSMSSNHQALISPKAIEILQRPKTSASISSKLSNRLMQVRSKASIEKYVATHKRILEERKKAEMNLLPKKKYNRALVNKNETANKLETILTEDQSIKRDQMVNKGVQKENWQSINAQNLEPSEKLMKEIVQKTQNTQRKSIKVSAIQIKSIDRPQSIKSINLKTPDENNLVPLSGSRQKTFHQKSNKNPQSIRKSITINQKDAQKTPKSNLSSFSNLLVKTKSKKILNKQPQINKQNSVNEENNKADQENSILSTKEGFQKLFNPILTLFGQKDLYRNSQQHSYLSDLQIPTIYSVLPQECFLSSQTGKRRSYIDSRIHHLQRKVHEQQDIIKHQDEQIYDLKCQKHKDGNTLQISNLELNSYYRQNVTENPINLSLIEEENHSAKNLNENDEVKGQQTLKQEMDSLNTKNQQNQFLLDNRSKCTVSKQASLTQKQLLTDCYQNPSNMSKLLSPKRLMLNSHLDEHSRLVQIQQTHLKRAEITKFVDKGYYSSVKGLYWVLINQKHNAYLMKKINQPKDPSVSQSLKYIKEFHKNRSQMLQGQDQITKHQEQQIYVDREFIHQHIQLPPKLNQQIHWLYFKPCLQSSVFPAELKLPQHYINSETSQSSINILVSLLNCILNLNPTFIERLFEPTYNNVFSCWLNRNGQFEPIYVDGYLPYNGKLNSFLAYSEEFLWIGVLLKCCAKLLGGYDKLLKLSFDDWSQLILGRSLTKLAKPSYKQIKQWQQDEFEPNVIEYLAKYQQKHKSTLIVRHKLTQSLFLITGIKNNKIKLSHIHSQNKRLEISLFQFIIDEHYELVLLPQSSTAYFRASEFESYERGNIVTYQMRVPENKCAVTLCVQMSSQQNTEPNFSKAKTPSHEKRRILIYEIPQKNKKQKSNKSEMILKYSSDNHPYSRTFSNHQGISILQMDLPQLKRGEYKIFIECGKIKLNDYFESHSKTITKWIKTQYSWNQKGSPRKDPNDKKQQNKKFRNVISVVSVSEVSLKGGRSVIVNDNKMENEVIEDENFVYKQGKGNKQEEEGYGENV